MVVAVLPLPFALRGVATFVRETVRVDAGDLAWLLRWPIGVITGRFRAMKATSIPASDWRMSRSWRSWRRSS